jgi:hypothetical protein
MRRHRQRLIAWIAIVAALLGTLAPTVSRAMARENAGRLLVAVCSASGTHWLALDRAATDGDAGTGSGEWTLSLDRCPCCFAQAGAAAPPPFPFAIALIASAHEPSPVFTAFAPRPRAAWLPSHPRAPPGHS